MKKTILHPDIYLGSVLVVLIVAILAVITPHLDAVFPPRPMACTEEARICPDGSAVMRSGPACAFAPCPNSNLPDRPGITEEPFEAPPALEVLPPVKTPPLKKEVMCTQDAKLCSDGSFVGRIAPDCDYAPCPDDLELDSDY